MRLGVHTWLQSLIIFFFFLTPFYSNAVISVGYWFNPGDYDKSSGQDNGYNFSQCKLDGAKGIKEYGNKSEAGEFIRVDVEKDSIDTNYGKDKGGFLLSAQWTYATSLKINAPEQYRKPILNALKNALANGNCELANYFADMLTNGKEYEDKEGRKNWGYSDDKEHGTSCVVGENSDSGLCRRKYLSEDNPDGTKRVCVTPAGSGDCSEDLSLDELSKKTNKKDDKTSDSGASSGKGDGSSIDDKRGGSNGTNNGSGTGNSGSGNGNSNQSGKGDGAGDGSGKGQGGGTGDKEGDGDKDKKEDVEIKAAPSMKEVFSGLRDKIKDKFLKDFEISGAQCPTAQISLFNRTFTIDQHCDILESIRDFMQSLMMFLYTFAAIRIVLSA